MSCSMFSQPEAGHKISWTPLMDTDTTSIDNNNNNSDVAVEFGKAGEGILAEMKKEKSARLKICVI